MAKRRTTAHKEDGMKHFLIPEEGNFYKANLHCHTTVSDGRRTPEEVKADYMAKGYQIVAYTDHELMYPHPELSDGDFLAMHGYEVSVNSPGEVWGRQRVCHICLVATRSDIDKQVVWNRQNRGYTGENRGPAYDLAPTIAKFDESEADFVREYTCECISEIMRRGRKAGFFVTYNHPTWSMEDHTNYMGYHGMHAMEIVNYGCLSAGYDDYNPRVYDEILRGGERIYCIAADDNHRGTIDCFGGFSMIKAPSLDYDTIGRALLDGHFYASEGPLIHSLWVEGKFLHVTCSPAKQITLNTGIIHTNFKKAEGGAPVTEAVFELLPEFNYVRITVLDGEGHHACTNAYFLDELPLGE